MKSNVLCESLDQRHKPCISSSISQPSNSFIFSHCLGYWWVASLDTRTQASELGTGVPYMQPESQLLIWLCAFAPSPFFPREQGCTPQLKVIPGLRYEWRPASESARSQCFVLIFSSDGIRGLQRI
ncbi:hypothetical protein H0G86_000744 [Trichoderma simmonsii]|uniref:Uncharacterized protein n=1 Tax=Trichoderma simmonsii TaxID=1491479 RepID=A0A8G0L092_9HYPO|nr:hypothetical protein H0G86_000744 [Trichoderma simmonsii]